MKFQPDTLAGVNNVMRFDGDSLRINAEIYTRSVLVPWRGTVQPWGCEHVEELSIAHFDQILMLAPDVVIFGSGARLKFVSPALYRGLMAHRIGLETMDSAAACRTYNVLANEGRRVVAAIVLEKAATTVAKE